MARVKVGAGSHHATPYERSSLTTFVSPTETKLGDGANKGTGGYDKRLLVTLVLKSAKDIKWAELGEKIGKTSIQCKDLWRKVVYPALVANKPWTASGKGWTAEMKLTLLRYVLNAVSPDWDAMSVGFPGKSKTQICDIWRKVILPRLKLGDTVE